MIERFQLVKVVGPFASTSQNANEKFDRLTLIYAENGRGKTTASAILSSLMLGDPSLVMERRRLGTADTPHVVIRANGNATLQFKDGSWEGDAPPMLVFDDAFVDANVCSGLSVTTNHRQNLHELIFGAQGVSLNAKLQQCVDRNEKHNKKLRELASGIPASARQGLTLDMFCAIPVPEDIDEQLQSTERNLAALKQSDEIQETPAFPELSLPDIDLDGLEGLLARDIDDLGTDAVAAVQQHAAKIGSGGEDWLASGMTRAEESDGEGNCPFCGQDLSSSNLFIHLQGYFGQAYKDLKSVIADRLRTFLQIHSGEATAAFERDVRVTVERRTFWSSFCDVPEVSIDTAEIAQCWKAMREQVHLLLVAKQQSPLERISLPMDLSDKVALYKVHCDAIAKLNSQLKECREAIDAVKEKARAGNLSAVKADHARLRAAKQRGEEHISAACDAYLAEKEKKAETEENRNAIKEQLKIHREIIFPKYESAINAYLQKFNATFRLSSVKATDTRGGPTCNYGVLVDNSTEPIDVAAPAGKGPSFKTALSSGDRNTLALAFFLATVDDHPQLAALVVVIDDPINSLDDHRTVVTAMAVRNLLQRVNQVIMLSHNKPFLCQLWEFTENSERAAYEIQRVGSGSELASWDVTRDCVTEHDKRHAMLEKFMDDGHENPREVAKAIRPHLEAFCRVAYPKWFGLSQLLGQFCGLCEQRIGQSDQILSPSDTEELKDLKDYANRFHHDTNLSRQTELINETELVGFVKKTLKFTRRP